MSGATVGAYLSHSFTTQRSGYYGSGEMFVFSIPDGGSVPVIYPWVGRDALPLGHMAELFLYADAERLAIGGGGTGDGHALELDGELDYGVSVASQTFGNPPLVAPHTSDVAEELMAGKKEDTAVFHVGVVEVWAILDDN